jgi:hypothetical protein
MLPVFTLGGFGGVWGLVLVGMNQEKIVSGVWSPDRHYRASIVQSTASDGCGSAVSSYVFVERQSFHIKTGEYTPFCVDEPPDHIAVSWRDSATLTIECRGCEGNYGYADENWGSLHFSYDLGEP